MSVIPEATATLRRHIAWRKAGKQPDKCPKPTASDVIDAELDRIGITQRPERGQQWAVLAHEVIDNVNGEAPQPPRMVQPIDFDKVREPKTDGHRASRRPGPKPKKTLAETLMEV